jgi:predicted peptidase
MNTDRKNKIIRDDSYSDLKSLPPDTGGKHLANVLGGTDAPYGFYIYLPAGYEQTAATYPMLVFLHGDGEPGE